MDDEFGIVIVDNANKKGEQTAPKASRTSISEPAGTWYEGPTPQQVRKRYRVQFHETTKVREFKNDESIPARPTSTTQEATPIKDLDPIVKKRDNDSINIAQIEFSRPVLDRATYNRTWKTIFKSKQKQFGFRLLHGENVHYVLGSKKCKTASGKFLSSMPQDIKDSKLLVPMRLKDLMITKRGSTLSELLRISPRNLTFESYLNPMIQYIYLSLRPDVRIKTDREWYERRLEYRWNVQHTAP
mmetsp:Transcript_36872/g.59103  ORF Transcript_36872/g.59103 Transcript_36872/m.59103 type:complete len:243 (-) Transcript_36872:378-1106(-)